MKTNKILIFMLIVSIWINIFQWLSIENKISEPTELNKYSYIFFNPNSDEKYIIDFLEYNSDLFIAIWENPTNYKLISQYFLDTDLYTLKQSKTFSPDEQHKLLLAQKIEISFSKLSNDSQIKVQNLFKNILEKRKLFSQNNFNQNFIQSEYQEVNKVLENIIKK